MGTIRLKHLIDDIDRHGNVRRYVRVPGRPKVRLKGIPGSEEFMAAYHAAVTGLQETVQAREARKGSFRHLCIQFYASAAFSRLDPGTQAWMRGHLDRLAQSYGGLPIAMLKQKHVRMMRDELKSTPGASRNRLKALRKLFSWAVEEEHALHDPTLGVKTVAYVTKGHHSWELSEVEQYERRHQSARRRGSL